MCDLRFQAANVRMGKHREGLCDAQALDEHWPVLGHQVRYSNGRYRCVYRRYV